MAMKPFPILFITAMDVGGAIASSGLIKRLHDEAPGARFTIVAGPDTAPLFAAVPELDQLIITKTACDGGMARFGLRRQLGRKRWSLIVDMRGIDIARSLKRERRAEIKPSPVPLHPVLAAARTLQVEEDPPAPYLFTTLEMDAEAAAHLGEGGPIVAMAPDGAWGGRVWPTERFAQIANRLFAPEGPLPNGRLLVLGPGGEDEATELARFAGIRQRVIGRPGDLDLAHGHACLKRCRLFIGNDNVWMHLAAAAGTPTLGLFGPSDEDVCRPWGDHARTVRGPRDFAAFRALDPNFNQAIGHMMDLSADAVLEAAVDLLNATKDRNG
ncbi:glycosyltransferase family 9 protein [soil metagenome]